jgi:hypothetical protein
MKKRKRCASILAYGKHGFKASLPQGHDEIVTARSSQADRQDPASTSFQVSWLRFVDGCFVDGLPIPDYRD